jgi:hypothetical protein
LSDDGAADGRLLSGCCCGPSVVEMSGDDHWKSPRAFSRAVAFFSSVGFGLT